jgi:RNA polymerase sigma-70 factor (ECF subfamily)
MRDGDPQPDDATLARAIAAAGAQPDRAAEAELCRRFAPRVRLYGLRHLRDPHAAADLVQQVLMTTLERLRAGEVREPGRIASFVLGMCRMMVLEQRRGARRRDALLETYADNGAHAEPGETRVIEAPRLERCLEALPERERSVLVLSFYAERPAEETGRELGLTAANVRVIRHRALARLRACIEGGGAA